MIDLDLHVPAIVARDAHAFGRWMAGAEGEMRASLRSFAAVVDVEAVLQEALLRVWQVAPRFAPDGKPNGLLRFGVRIARNLAVSETRRMKTRPIPDADDEPLLACEPEEPDPMLRATIVKCRDALPDKPRQALDQRLSSEGRDSDDDLAARLGMRLNTFLQNFGRARRMLAECLRKHGVSVDEELLS
jgi:RNA polymerase sigma-70 factor (ECF subfamily)